MQIAAGMKIDLKGSAYQIVFCDDVQVTLCDINNHKRRQHVEREEFDEAYLLGEVTPYVEGFPPEVWREDSKDAIQPLRADLASPEERADIDYKLPYARYFVENIVSANEQKQVVQQIASELDHSRIPGPSTVRRWASRLKQSGFDPAALIGRRRQSFR